MDNGALTMHMYFVYSSVDMTIIPPPADRTRPRGDRTRPPTTGPSHENKSMISFFYVCRYVKIIIHYFYLQLKMFYCFV